MKNIINPVDTDDGLFHDGDPTTETEGTIVYARIMNDIQGATIDLQTEMKNVLADAGFTPDPAKQNQLLLAIQKIVSNGISTDIKDATTTTKGIVQLSSATNSTSETLAATPKAVKAAYDLANSKLSSVPDATTTVKGIVQLSSATDSDSETLAATPKAVKVTHDLAAAALPLTGGTCTGQVIAPNFASTPDAIPVGAGMYSEQLGKQAPFFQPNWQWPVTSGGIFVPIAKGTSTRKDKGWPTAISYGYYMPGTDMHAHPVIHALGDSGMECTWEFNTQTGGINSKAGAFITEGWCPFPVGYFMLMGNDSDPNVIYPGTTWQDMTAAHDGRSINLGYDALGTGGNNSVTLGIEHMPPHGHGLKAYHSNTSLDGGSSNRYSVDPTNGAVAGDVVVSSGGGQSFDVTNAYVHVRGWMRTA